MENRNTELVADVEFFLREEVYPFLTPPKTNHDPFPRLQGMVDGKPSLIFYEWGGILGPVINVAFVDAENLNHPMDAKYSSIYVPPICNGNKQELIDYVTTHHPMFTDEKWHDHHEEIKTHWGRICDHPLEKNATLLHEIRSWKRFDPKAFWDCFRPLHDRYLDELRKQLSISFMDQRPC